MIIGRIVHSLSICLSIAAIFSTRESSAQWIAQTSPTDAELRGLSIVSPRVVWASGTRGTVIHTTDGGKSWRVDTVPGAGALDFRAIAATSATVAHAMSIGDSSRIYRTTDGGRSWSLRFANARNGAFFDAIRFWDATHGIAMSDPVEGRFYLVTTSDGGATWQDIPIDQLPPALPGEGAFAASGSCLTLFGSHDVWLASGGAAIARVYHSPDRGRSWTIHDTPIRAGSASAGIFSIAFADAKRGVIAGGDYRHPTLRGRNLAITVDGGERWTLSDSLVSPAGYRSAVAYWPGSHATHLFAVGPSGTDTSRDGGRSWSPTDSVAFNSVAFVTQGKRCARGWAVGPKGRIAMVSACLPARD